jgi:NTP pyrophosphatase (non-canonical NTP hydrolase)
MFNTKVNAAGMEVRYSEMVERLWKKEDFDSMLRHAAMGVGGEAGELIDCLKKVSVYGKELDRVNLVEELGDMMFYLTIIMSLFGVGEAEVLQANATKLSKRYENLVYSDMAAQVRADKLDGV